MKKTRFLAFLLTLSMLAAVLLPGSALAAEETFAVKARNALLVDADYGEVLFEQNAHDKAYPASITKVMTALLVLEAVNSKLVDLDAVVTVPEAAMEGLAADGSTQNIDPGEQMSVRNLLYCLMVASANEAANILAIYVSGSVSAFVEQMNQRAQELGCTGTHFTNPHGLHNDDHYTTAYDIYLMVQEALKDPLFQTIAGTKTYEVPATNLHDARKMTNTNRLISRAEYLYEPCTGVKTGSTGEAGLCLVSSATKDGRTLIAVVLGASSVKLENGNTELQQFTESKRLLEHGFNDFSRKAILNTATLIREVPVTLSNEASTVVVHPAENMERYLPNGVDPADFRQLVQLDAESVEAPVEKGQVMGSITISYEGEDLGTVDLVALNDVERSEFLYRQQQIKEFFGRTEVRIGAAALGALLLIVLLRSTVFRPQRQYGRSSGSRPSGYRGRRRK